MGWEFVTTVWMCVCTNIYGIRFSFFIPCFFSFFFFYTRTPILKPFHLDDLFRKNFPQHRNQRNLDLVSFAVWIRGNNISVSLFHADEIGIVSSMRYQIVKDVCIKVLIVYNFPMKCFFFILRSTFYFHYHIKRLLLYEGIILNEM